MSQSTTHAYRGLECQCLKCGHEWTLRRPRIPKVCPKCKNPKWRDGPKRPKIGRPPKETQYDPKPWDFFSS